MEAIKRLACVVLGLLLAAPVAAQGQGGSEREAGAVEVKMVDKGPTSFVFEPAVVQVRPGDRVVWIQAGVMPHNVEFTEGPTGGGVEGLPASSFLTMRGQRFEIEIDDRFRPGVYTYICTPHAAMGMTGTIEVVERTHR